MEQHLGYVAQMHMGSCSESSKSSPGKSLFYKKHGYVYSFFFSDAGYVGDKGDRKFITGYLTLVECNLVT